MQEIAPLVSVIIPAYNAAAFLRETIGSVKAQNIQDWEMIIIDDGSRDATQAVLEQEADRRIQTHFQENAGVSVARNKGLQFAKGKYVVFLDADDLMDASFLEVRTKALEENPAKGYACGCIETFPGIPVIMKGVAEDPENEILFFKPGVSTVPSNYMIRRSILAEKKIMFNAALSSSADRFFLLQLTKVTDGTLLPCDHGRLLYRISSNSMSHNINPGLIFDNVKLYQEIKAAGLMPEKSSRFSSQFFFSIALGFAKTRKPGLCLLYMLRSAATDPVVFFRRLFKKIKGK